MQTFELLIKNARVFPAGRQMDIGVHGGRIAALAPALAEDAAQVVDAGGRLVAPGFVDVGLCLDQAYLADTSTAETPGTARAAAQALVRRFDEKALAADITRRAARLLDKSIAGGVTTVLAPVGLSPEWDEQAVKALTALRKTYADRIELRIAADVQGGGSAQNDGVDCVFGVADSADTAPAVVERTLTLAQKQQRPAAIVCAAWDEADIRVLQVLAEQTITHGMQGRVLCLGANALDARGLNEDLATETIMRCVMADITFVSAPSVDLQLMGQDRRGPTRVRQLIESGARVAVSCGHMRDSYCPFGTGSLLRQALLSAQIHKFGTTHELASLMECLTTAPAGALGLTDYGLMPGCRADMVLFDAPSPAQAILSRRAPVAVYKAGRLVAQHGRVLKQMPVGGDFA